MKFFAVDKNPDSVSDTLVNNQLVGANIKGEQVDLLTKQDFFPEQKTFDLILSNPPWMISNPIDSQDNGSYDPRGEFL